MSADRSTWWRAALRRDPAWDGRFVFAVTTTGVYCRPSCPARRPLMKHVLFFDGPDAAEREGFRACRRCGSPGGNLLLACEYIASRLDGPLRLEAVGRHVGRSPAQLGRLFRRALGVSPKEYARRLRFERFKLEVRRAPDVTAALYRSGFGSTRSLYERSGSHLGMTPATYARKGEGMDIAYDIVDSPLGRALVAATPLGLCAVRFGPSDRALAAELKREFPRARVRRESALLRFARRRLAALFAKTARDPLLPLHVRSTAFQARVWEALRSIPYGEARSYAEIARALCRPRAVRAVARACAANPVALLIPCHRAVGSDGALRGYRWGLRRKRSLLALERDR